MALVVGTGSGRPGNGDVIAYHAYRIMLRSTPAGTSVGPDV